MLDTIIVIDTFRFFYKIDSLSKFSDFREVFRQNSSIIFRELSNRIVVSIRGLEDKQNEVYLNGVKLNNPIWGFFYANALPLNLISSSNVILNNYRVNFEISGEKEIGFFIGSYNKFSMYYKNGTFGIERTYNENNYRYWDSFNREYQRKNNFEDKIGGFLNFKNLSIIFYDGIFGMPLRGYGNEGSDFEIYKGLILSYKNHYFNYQFYRYNYEKPYESYILDLNYFQVVFSNMEEFHKRFIFKMPFKYLGYFSIVLDENNFKFDYLISKAFRYHNFIFELALKRRIPNFSELYYKSNYAIGNQSLTPENFYTLQMKYKLFDIFITYIQNPILWLPDENYWKAQNLNYLFLYGFEMDYNYRFLEFSVSYIKNKLSNNMILPYRPNLTISASINYNFSSFLKDKLVFIYYSKRPSYYYPSSFYLEPILIIDYYKFFEFKKFFFYIYFKNLLNKSYEFIKGYPMESFSLNIKGGLKW
ncbi:MAG: Plug domain-containing protein [candidate division WOR-3 bacterium]